MGIFSNLSSLFFFIFNFIFIYYESIDLYNSEEYVVHVNQKNFYHANNFLSTC